MSDPSPAYGRFTFGERGRPLRLDRDAVECAKCGAHVDFAASWRCQGTDACEDRFCDGCKQTCYSCVTPLCGEHSTEIDGEPQCPVCVALLVEESADSLSELRTA
jgi:hypothetical protein